MTDINQDDLSKALESDQNEQITAEIAKIKLGDKEYTQEELNQYVGIANQVQEAEKRYNTKLDKVWPEYGRSQQKLKELEDEVTRLKQPKTDIPQDQQTQIEEAKKAARQLGILTKDDLAELGIVTKADFEQNYRIQRATEKLLEDADKLEKEYDGKDGRPAFRKEEILQYMNDTGIRDLNTAYKVKYESELDTWKDSKLGSAKRNGMSTMEPGPIVNKQGKEVKITKDNLNAMVAEAMAGKF